MLAETLSFPIVTPPSSSPRPLGLQTVDAWALFQPQLLVFHFMPSLTKCTVTLFLTLPLSPLHCSHLVKPQPWLSLLLPAPRLAGGLAAQFHDAAQRHPWSPICSPRRLVYPCSLCSSPQHFSCPLSAHDLANQTPSRRTSSGSSCQTCQLLRRE